MCDGLGPRRCFVLLFWLRLQRPFKRDVKPPARFRHAAAEEGTEEEGTEEEGTEEEGAEEEGDDWTVTGMACNLSRPAHLLHWWGQQPAVTLSPSLSAAVQGAADTMASQPDAPRRTEGKQARDSPLRYCREFIAVMLPPSGLHLESTGAVGPARRPHASFTTPPTRTQPSACGQAQLLTTAATAGLSIGGLRPPACCFT
jgi:hypothetical protein